MGATLRRWYLPAAMAAAAVYFVAGRPSPLFNLIGASSPCVILLAARTKPRLDRAPWYLFALGQALFVAGDIVAYNYERFFAAPLPYPSISDLLYLLVYPCLVAGLMLLVRRRRTGRDRGSVIDSLMVGIGAGTLSWAFLISPYALDNSMRLSERLVSMAYPLMDLMLLTVAIHLAVGTGRRTTSLLLLLSSVLSLLLTDAIYGWLLLHSGYTPGSGPLELGWIAFYLLFGTAALHPSSSELTEPLFEASATANRLGPLLFGGASLTAPLTALVLVSNHEHDSVPLLLSATIALFVLAMVRMLGLMAERSDAARRANAIREAGAALTGASSPETIVEAAGRAVAVLAPDASPTIWHRVPAGGFEGIHGTGVGLRASLDDLEDWQQRRLADGKPFQVASDGCVFAVAMRGADRFVYVRPWHVRGQVEFVLALGLDHSLSPSAAMDVDGLSAQVELALESARLAQDLYEEQGNARLTSLIKNSSDVFAIVAPDTTVRYISPSVQRLFGIEPEAVQGTALLQRVHPIDRQAATSFFARPPAPDESASFEGRILHEDGSSLYVDVIQTNLLRDESVQGIVVNVRDISERKAFEEQLSHQAFHDPVTGLANRALFRDRVRHALERRRRSQISVAVLFLDLDDFKTVNDTLGHAAGDTLLREVGRRIQGALREADTAARIGGDEFAILLDDPNDATPVATRALEALQPPFQIHDREVVCRASIGIAVARHGEDADEESLLRDADVAMYLAKENGKGRFEVFDPGLHEQTVRRLQLRSELEHALDRDQLILHYQPIVDLRTATIVGLEALVRWNHPTRGIVPPLEFIPLAEETGLIVPIGEWVLRTACEFATRIATAHGRMEIAVNLSARQFARGGHLVDDVRQVLEDTELTPNLLTLEITETVMMQDVDASIDLLRMLKELGVRLAVDDFGTGYSSLNYVRRFPVDILKIDKSFVDAVESDADQTALTAAVVDLARVLRLVPLAEGIEREEQRARLEGLGCELGQGYLFARPLDEAGIERLLGGAPALASATAPL